MKFTFYMFTQISFCSVTNWQSELAILCAFYCGFSAVCCRICLFVLFLFLFCFTLIETGSFEKSKFTKSKVYNKYVRSECNKHLLNAMKNWCLMAIRRGGTYTHGSLVRFWWFSWMHNQTNTQKNESKLKQFIRIESIDANFVNSYLKNRLTNWFQYVWIVPNWMHSFECRKKKWSNLKSSRQNDECKSFIQ